MITISRRRTDHYNVHLDDSSEREEVDKVVEKAKLKEDDIVEDRAIGLDAIAAHGPYIILTDSGYKKFFKSCKEIITKLLLWSVKGHKEHNELVNPSDFDDAPELKIH